MQHPLFSVFSSFLPFFFLSFFLPSLPPSLPSSLPSFLPSSSPEHISSLLLETEDRREKKNRWLPSIHTLMGNCMFLDQGSNLPLLSYGTMLQPAEPHQPGHYFFYITIIKQFFIVMYLGILTHGPSAAFSTVIWNNKVKKKHTRMLLNI